MYSKRLKYLAEEYPKGKALSGLLLCDLEEASIGTPLIARIDPFNGSVRDEDGSTLVKKPSGWIATAENLLELDPVIAQKIMILSISRIAVIPLLSMYKEYDYKPFVVSPQNFFPRKETPLIYDSGGSVTTTNLFDQFNQAALSHIEEFIADRLKIWRYFNIVIQKLAQSKRPDLLTGINAVMNALKHDFSYNTGYTLPYTPPRYLIDEVSISFYRLSDAIPIYDVKRTRGLCVEIMLLSSATNYGNMDKRPVVFRFLFSKFKDGVFSIDGERVKRHNETTVDKCLNIMYDILAASMPNDLIYKKSRKKTEEDF